MLRHDMYRHECLEPKKHLRVVIQPSLFKIKAMET